MEEDYYRILGIERSASDTDIHKAYRKMARKYHPDMNPDDAKAKAAFQRVQRAYEVLSDAKKRELYDRFGSAFETAGANPFGSKPGGRPGAGPAGEDFNFGQFFEEGAGGDAGGFADIFRQFTRGTRRTSPRNVPKGEDLLHEIEIPFQTSVRGGEAQINVVRAEGTTETITVKIPAGIDDGKKIRIRGQGAARSSEGPPGDIVLTVRVAAHPFFQRRGKNLEVRLPITLKEAIEGAKVDLPTADGIVSLTVPAGCSSGRRLRVRGLGLASKDGTRGDLFAEVQIVLPDPLDPRLVECVKQMDVGPKHPRTGLSF